MIDRIMELSIRHRFLVIAAAIAMAIGCVWAFMHTPVDAIPDLSENQVIVFTEWAGRSPREIEDQVTYPLSLALQGLSGVRTVRSSSDVGYSMINVIMEDHVDVEFARRQLAERLAGLGQSLPSGVAPRLAPDALATGQIYWYVVEGQGHDPGRLRAIQDWYIRPTLQSVSGVAEVASVGGFPPEFHVEIDPHRLRAHGVSVSDVLSAVARANESRGGSVLQHANAEFLVRAVGALGQSTEQHASAADQQQICRELELAVIPSDKGLRVTVRDVAAVTLGAGLRRGVFEKDGNEVTGGVVLMRRGENPLEVTRRLKLKITELRAGLPNGVHIVPCYDRTPLIEGATRTLTSTVFEAIVIAVVCVILVLLHFRASLIIALALPLAAGAPFLVLWFLHRWCGVDIPSNIMSLAGIAISIGVLVDASIVMVENAMHRLKTEFGDQRVRGDVRMIVLDSCKSVGRPIFLSVVIMLLSFLPVFALGGMEGKMFRPLAVTKSFAMLAAALLTITVVPALCTIFIRGRLRGDEESWIVRSMIQVYRPVLTYFLNRPSALVWFMSVTFLVGFAPLGVRLLTLVTLFLGLVACALSARTWFGKFATVAGLIVIALIADQTIKPLGWETMTPLDEGMVMDMPITVPRASVTQAADDLKARNMVLCRFPEVLMVVGKAGRAETPTDPAPLDMIETMVEFRSNTQWPSRRLDNAHAEKHAGTVLDELISRGYIERAADDAARKKLVREATQTIAPSLDALLREHAYIRNKEFENTLGHDIIRLTVEHVVSASQEAGALRQLSDQEMERLIASAPHDHAAHLAMSPTLEDISWLAQRTARQLVELGFAEAATELLRDRPSVFSGVAAILGVSGNSYFERLHQAVLARHAERWQEHLVQLNFELEQRAAAMFTRLVAEEFLASAPATDPEILALANERRWNRANPPLMDMTATGHHHGPSSTVPYRVIPALEWVIHELVARLTPDMELRQVARSELRDADGELDRAVRMPGWTNVWTMPIQNRVDMLATGVNTAIGVRVLGTHLDDVVAASEAIAVSLKKVRGAADVIADPIRGKGYLEIVTNREKAANYGVSAADVNELVETAIGGRVVTTAVLGRERYPVRVRFGRAWREDEDAVKNMPIRVGNGSIPLTEVAGVQITEGPASIKSENGMLRNYVRCNVRDRDVAEFVDDARRAIARDVPLPAGVYVEWTGQFEHDLRARQTLILIIPIVLALICFTLYLTFRDWWDVLLVLLAVPGAIAGGVFFQWLFGFTFSITVWVGYIACFGMAAATGIIMLVYLRQAVAKAGGLEKMTLDQLRQAVMDGAVHRLRPKLLTEATTILGLAPLLWATGVGAEVVKPMAAPVLGGLLIADEVIDLFLPVLFYRIRRWRWTRIHGLSR